MRIGRALIMIDRRTGEALGTERLHSLTSTGHNTLYDKDTKSLYTFDDRDVLRYAVGDDGFESPAIGSFRTSSGPRKRVWISSDATRLIGSDGTVFDALTLEPVRSVGKSFTSMSFTSSAGPAILREKRLVVYDRDWRETGGVDLDHYPLFVAASGDSFITFTNDGKTANGMTARIIPGSAIVPLTPTVPTDPTTFGLQQKDTFVTDLGLFGFLDSNSGMLFHWDINARKLLPPVGLVGAPLSIGWSNSNQKLYCSYQSGLVTAGNYLANWRIL